MLRSSLSTRLLVCILATVALAAVVLSTSSVRAVEPSLAAIDPYGFQRGNEIDVEFKGTRLADAKQLLLYSPGITVTNLEAASDSVVKVKMSIAADCRLGIHAVRVCTATGVSNLQTFSVGALPEIKEVEPNSDFNAPQPVTLGCTINGVVATEDVDYFVVEAKQGQRITAELEGLRLGGTFFDPYLAILNEARFELARSDDKPLLYQDCLCSIIAPADGKYIIQVRESAYGGDGNSRYRLHVGSFPRPTAVLPAGGRPGESLDITWIGDAAGNRTGKVVLPTAPASEFGLFAQDELGIAPSPNTVRISDLPNVIEAEPNDTREEATAGTAPGAFNGIIEKPGDVDHFKFHAKQGETYDIRVYARRPLRSPLDSVLSVLRSTGAGVASNDDTGGPDSYLRFTAPAEDDFVVVVQDHLKSGGPDYVYRVEIVPVVPSLSMRLPERVQYIPTILNVPRGNRMALMVTATRTNFGGELKVDLKDAPPGMTLQSVPMAANRTEVPLLFSAAADAAPAGALADLIGQPTDESQKIVGHLYQRTMLIRGQNNTDVWGHDADRMAVAITDEVPFRIDIVQPQVPLVRNGSMELKIVATRAEGFTAPIAVRFLYNPPGVASSASISIPEGQNEAVIPLTANSGAEINTWPIVVTGQSRVGNGTVEVATQMADLVVADSFFNFVFQKAAVEQGKETLLVVNVEKKADFDGEAAVQLLGLPAGTATEPTSITKDTTEMDFKIKAEATSRPGIFKSLVCQAIITQNGEPITHTIGGGELRIDEPLPPKVEAVAKPMPAPMPTPMPVAVAPQPVKRLSRLEQLRLDREKERESEQK
jgi:hypothetical protein